MGAVSPASDAMITITTRSSTRVKPLLVFTLVFIVLYYLWFGFYSLDGQLPGFNA
jgi:hypothetical protein